MVLLKHPQFLPNGYKTQSKLSTLECLIWTENRYHWVKIVLSRCFDKSICTMKFWIGVAISVGYRLIFVSERTVVSNLFSKKTICLTYDRYILLALQ